jgi:benzil reductase ((S)-benzoin forming)
MNYYIITGASKGLGEAIVQSLFHEENAIIAISRTVSEKLLKEANDNRVPLLFETEDLSVVEHLIPLMERVFQHIRLKDAQSVTFIQNAGVIEPIKPVGKMDHTELVRSVNVNLLAPMILANQFVERTRSFAGKKVIVHVTSGAANRTVHGWSSYSSTKAGLERFTKTLAFEQKNESFPVQAIAFSPGIMDTDMQQTIRTSQVEDFNEVKTFQNYYEKGMLRSPQLVASKLLTLLQGNVESGKVYDIKSLLN